MRADREPLRHHFNGELRAGKWVAFGYSETLGKRIRIEAPWRDDLIWDDAGGMIDGIERYSNVLFYQAGAGGQSF